MNRLGTVRLPASDIPAAVALTAWWAKRGRPGIRFLDTTEPAQDQAPYRALEQAAFRGWLNSG